MFAATLQSPAAIYREDQHFGLWLYATLVGMVALAWMTLGGHPPGAHAAVAPAKGWAMIAPVGFVVGVTLPTVLVVGVLRMTTEVTPSDLRVWFGFIPTYRHYVPIVNIERLEVVQFRPLLDHGFWGVRSGRDGERVLTARGNRGVRLTLADGTTLLVGSQNPEALARALQQSMMPEG